jgi:tRNA (guanine-N7-)-methyltransferase
MPRAPVQTLADTLVDWQRPPWPVRWPAAFGRHAPLALEIGFGNGDFLVEQAQLHPERNHVGIEVSWTAATYLFRRLRAAGCTNVRVLLGDAEELVLRLFEPDALDEVTVNHPCPWPKARHHARRLLVRGFLQALAERMRPGARLTVVTDHAEYAAWLGDELAAQRALVSCHATVSVSALPGRSSTKYQRKAMAAGIPIHYFEWHKPASAAPARAEATRALPHEISMPTLTLRGALASAEPLEGFRPVLFRERTQELEVVVRLLAVYRRTEPKTRTPVWLIEAFVQEGRLRQQFALDVVLREGGVLLKPALLGQPFPTHGVKRAVWCAGRLLLARHPGLALEHDSLGLAAPPLAWPDVEAERAALAAEPLDQS